MLFMKSDIRDRLFGIRKFLGSKSGNIGMIASFMIVPTTFMLGTSIDFLRYASAKNELRGALDSGILAAASLDNKLDDYDLDRANVENMVRNYLALNVDTKLIDVDRINISTSLIQNGSGREVNVDATYSMNTVFLHLLNYDDLDINISAAGKQSYATLEVSMVLDISSSMNDTKLNAMKNASKTFIDTILNDDSRDLTSINIVPFGGTVNLGNDFLGYVDSATIDLGGNDLDYSDGHGWNGCFELGANDFDDGDFDSTNNPNLPHFWKYRDFNPWCPHSASEAIFLSNNNTDLKNKIDALSRSDGTGMDIGAAVGLKALSPSWQGVISNTTFPARPTSYANDTQKIMVIMTDGEITTQHRPRAQNAKESSGVGCIEANKKKKNNPNKNSKIDCQAGTSERPASGKDTTTVRNNFYNVCNIAKERGIIIYTIGFQIKTNNWSHTALGECPQTLSNYYFVEDTDIASAFDSIAASINGLRVIK